MLVIPANFFHLSDTLSVGLTSTLLGNVFEEFLKEKADYVSNIRQPSFPDGLDVEIMSMEALSIAWRESIVRSDREHVTQFIWRQPQRFQIRNVSAAHDLSRMRWTVDEAGDLNFVRRVFAELHRKGKDGLHYKEVLKVIQDSDLTDTSTEFVRNEGQIRAMLKDNLNYSENMKQFEV